MQEPTTVDQGVVPSRFHSHLHRPTAKTLLIVSVALAVYVFLIMMVMNFSLVKFAFATHGDRFETVEGGVPTWYKSEFGMIRKVAGPEGFKNAPVTVLEAIPYGATPNEFAVLAKVAGVEGIAIGILHANNTFENVLSDGTNKADLAVRPDGMALYSAMVGGDSHLMQIDLTKPGAAPSNLGRGRSPRVFTDGVFVAISEIGIVRIDPATKSTETLIPNSLAYGSSGALSITGKELIVPGASGKSALLEVQSTSPSSVKMMRELSVLLPTQAEFLGGDYIIAPDRRGNVRIYSKSTNKALVGVLPIS